MVAFGKDLVQAVVYALFEFEFALELLYLFSFGEIQHKGILLADGEPQLGCEQDYEHHKVHYHRDVYSCSVFLGDTLHCLALFFSSLRAFSMVLVMTLIATLLCPPWGMMMSAKRLLGSMNCRYMGFTVRL